MSLVFKKYDCNLIKKIILFGFISIEIKLIGRTVGTVQVSFLSITFYYACFSLEYLTSKNKIKMK